MKKKLHVLIVEDSADDYELIKIVLAKAGLEAICERVDTEASMSAALDRNRYDIVLSDHAMPNFNSREALRLLRERDSDLPFILVSGKIGETAAVQLMKAGANDYVSKNHLELLPPSVTRALNEQESIMKKRQAEEELACQHAFLKEVIDTNPGLVFVKDKDGHYLLVNKATAESFGMNVEHMIGKMDTELGVLPEESDKYRQDEIDVLESGKSKYIPEERYSWPSGEVHYYQTTKQPLLDEKGVPNKVLAVCVDITKRKKAEEELVKAYENIKVTLDGTVSAITTILDKRDPYTSGHEKRVSKLVVAIAEEMGLSSEEVEELRISSVLHDIGKIFVPAEILSKPGRLTDIEFDLIKMHARVGYDIVKEAALPCSVGSTILQHHERLDGSGYPEGIKKDKISQNACILAVADVVEAMSSHRPYRSALGIDKALEEISENKNTLYDPDVVDACVRVFKEKKFKF